MNDDVVKRAVAYAAASFERQFPYYKEGIVSDVDEIVAMLREALAYYGVQWTFGQRNVPEKRRRGRRPTGDSA